MNIYASGRPIEQYYLRWERFANPFIQWVASVVISLLLWNKCKTYFNLSRVFFIYWYIKASIATGTCQSSGWEGGGVKQDHIFYSTLLLLVLIVFRIFVYIFELLCFIDLGVGWLSVCVCVFVLLLPSSPSATAEYRALFVIFALFCATMLIADMCGFSICVYLFSVLPLVRDLSVTRPTQPIRITRVVFKVIIRTPI